MLARAEKGRLIRKCTVVAKSMSSVFFFPPKKIKGKVRNWVMEPKNPGPPLFLEAIKAETSAFPAENSVSTKRDADNLLQSV